MAARSSAGWTTSYSQSARSSAKLSILKLFLVPVTHTLSPSLHSFTLRGAQTVAFYALPEHATYYTDVLSFPFAPPRPGKSVAADERPTLDAGDVSVTALYSRYDLMRLERVVGTKLAHRMVSEEKGTWRWA